MSFRSGIDAQIGTAAESTWDTFATPVNFYEFESESLKNSIARMEVKDIRKSSFVQRTDRWAAGRQSVAGDISLAVKNKGFGSWFYWMLGAFQTTADGTGWKHTLTPGDLHGVSKTIQVGRPSVGGTVEAFSYTGCKCDSWELSNSSSDELKLKVTVDGAEEDTAQALAAASFPSGTELFYFTEGAITVAGTEFDVLNWSVQGKNAMKTDRYYIGGTSPAVKKEQERNAYSDYSGTLVADFTDLTAYDRFVNGTLATIVLTYTGALTYDAGKNYKCVVTIQNARFDGDTPNVSGPDMLQQTLPFVALDDGTNPAVQIDYYTSDASVTT